MKLQDQIKLLQDSSGCSEVITRLNNEYKEVFDERTVVNRQVKQLEAEVNAIPVIDPNLPDEELDFKELNTKLEAAHSFNNEIYLLNSRIDAKKENVRSLQERIDRLRKEISGAQNQIENEKSEQKELQAQINGRETIDVDDLIEKIKNIQMINKSVSEKQKYAAIRERYREVSNESESLTEKLEAIKDEKIEIIRASNLPIDGLEFDEDGVYLNGISIDQISSGERTKLSVAIGMSLNPELRVMLVHDGSLLDSKHFSDIAEAAKDNGYQVWIESVSEGGNVGIVIEDGEVYKDHYE